MCLGVSYKILVSSLYVCVQLRLCLGFLSHCSSSFCVGRCLSFSLFLGCYSCLLRCLRPCPRLLLGNSGNSFLPYLLLKLFLFASPLRLCGTQLLVMSALL